MVMDLQDARETLETAVARSQIRLLDSSSKSLSLDPSSSRRARIEAGRVGLGSDGEDEGQEGEDLASDSDGDFDDEELPYSEDENVELHFTGRSAHRAGHRPADILPEVRKPEG